MTFRPTALTLAEDSASRCVLRAVARAVVVVCLPCALTPAFAGHAFAADPVVVLDRGDDASAWTAIASPSATARLEPGDGRFALDFDLGRGRSHAIVRRPVSVDLPADYMFVFEVASDAEPNTIEIKFISGENVWWRRLADVDLVRDWGAGRTLRVSRPRIAFAWGPAGGGMPSHLDAIEIAVVAGKGGKGKVWIDEIRLEPRDPEAGKKPPVVAVSSNPDDAANLTDGNPATAWRSADRDRSAAVTLDFHEPVEQGGLIVEHVDPGFSEAYVVEASLDGSKWDQVRRIEHGNGGTDHLFLPDVWSRYLRLRFDLPGGRHGAIGEIRVQPFEYSASINGFFAAIAKLDPPGSYPRYFSGEQSYWTVVGAPGDDDEALVNEEGSVEVAAGSFTIEPFLWRDGLRTWKDATTSVSLEDGELPIPTVVRRDGDLTLSVTAFASAAVRPDSPASGAPQPTNSTEGGAPQPGGPARGASGLAGIPSHSVPPDDAASIAARLERTASDASPPERTSTGNSTLYLRYRLETSAAPSRVRLYLAIRPFQVLPPWQALNRTGGATTIRHVARVGRTVSVDDRRVITLTGSSSFGAATFEQGDIVEFLRGGVLPAAHSADDEFGHASAALAWDLDLHPGTASEVWIAVPSSKEATVDGKGLAKLLTSVRDDWRARVARVPIELPGAAADWVASLRSNLAYILIHRDGDRIQPGSRTYERSWIRDGAMTSGALLELGLDEEVKGFLRWFSGYIGDDGYVPCCVDARGADPVPENDSYGEFIWAVAETWRFTRDEAFVKEMWPKVRAAASHMSRLRASRMTPDYQNEEKRAFFGLLPESISHEGYSARPVHSYWDQAFALRGFADAAMLAGVVGDVAAQPGLAAERDAFAKDLAESIRRTTEAHRLDVVPASVELGDFDPTSTAVSFLLGTDGVYPVDALGRSFDKYVADVRGRRGLDTPGVGYTAYELRNATALVLLGRKQEAIDLLSALVADQRPPAWNQWPEISWLRRTEPQFLGDIPHTWIGSTFVHAVRTLLVAERDGATIGSEGPGSGASLWIGEGIPLAWLDGGAAVRARSLPTWFGPVSVEFRAETGSSPGKRRATVKVVAAAAQASEAAAVPAIEAGAAEEGEAPPRRFESPDGGIHIAAPFGAEAVSATVNGEAATLERGSVRASRLPATVVFEYKPPRE